MDIPCRKITETPWSQYGGEEWELGDFIELMKQTLLEIPFEFRDSAKFVFEGGNCENSGNLTISYTRVETPEQAAARYEADQRGRERLAQQKELADRREFERLSRKYASRLDAAQ